MGEFESIREIAKRLVEEYRIKKMSSVEECVCETPVDIQGAMDILNEPKFNGIDREWLRNMGIEA